MELDKGYSSSPTFQYSITQLLRSSIKINIKTNFLFWVFETSWLSSYSLTIFSSQFSAKGLIRITSPPISPAIYFADWVLNSGWAKITFMLSKNYAKEEIFTIFSKTIITNISKNFSSIRIINPHINFSIIIFANFCWLLIICVVVK